MYMYVMSKFIILLTKILSGSHFNVCNNVNIIIGKKIIPFIFVLNCVIILALFITTLILNVSRTAVVTHIIFKNTVEYVN